MCGISSQNCKCGLCFYNNSSVNNYLKTILGVEFLFGICGNIIIFYILQTRFPRKSAINLCLKILAMTDTVFLLSGALFEAHVFIEDNFKAKLYFSITWLLSVFAQSLSRILLIIAGAVQYLVICKPSKFKACLTKRNTLVSTVFLTFIIIISSGSERKMVYNKDVTVIHLYSSTEILVNFNNVDFYSLEMVLLTIVSWLLAVQPFTETNDTASTKSNQLDQDKTEENKENAEVILSKDESIIDFEKHHHADAEQISFKKMQKIITGVAMAYVVCYASYHPYLAVYTMDGPGYYFWSDKCAPDWMFCMIKICENLFPSVKCILFFLLY